MLRRNRKNFVHMIDCSQIFYDEVTGGIRDRHPLKYRYLKGVVTVPMPEMDKDMQLSAATAFFDLGIIVRNQLRFHEDIRPSFEDAHFVARYIAFSGQGHAAFLKRARYFSREIGSASCRDRGCQTGQISCGAVLSIQKSNESTNKKLQKQ